MRRGSDGWVKEFLHLRHDKRSFHFKLSIIIFNIFIPTIRYFLFVAPFLLKGVQNIPYLSGMMDVKRSNPHTLNGSGAACCESVRHYELLVGLAMHVVNGSGTACGVMVRRCLLLVGQALPVASGPGADFYERIWLRMFGAACRKQIKGCV